MGLLLTSSIIMPMYSPIIPNIKNCIPKKKVTEEKREANPGTDIPKNSFLKIM